ncbi:Isochorismatase hydrolase [Mycolicibacterium phlei]|jgi:nicotinamidase-related amidase|uniref:Isochorismatase n=1 Tax=Mycolicibacterium phlei DSM 43239 = CCUG 21000 TaxID=1226750 RepID=A0A5N5V208_MYCPH|nr:cysteine hydrolase family protein [Mycolicibacterium phlei]VEG10841.1 Isochorismatase hydrolase [Mycobacteroides chelonae]AMO62740.1 Streptothricin hydrolase [Mycolicibacterium phlei]EID14438.1 isochorismatase hydrolase [Mycolicibacterium phlei RIVM601174]KAB7755933.1 isochorismatase [Mycolicibacterium phlei DSM 43239 = CCUG 21000]KXW65890.1 isochorismatase [Mycolicibacterium phlei DSM 43239 = CCUG 21000]
MAEHPTLRALVGLPDQPESLASSALVLIDCQNTYTRGVMELDGVQAALDEAEALLDRARTAGIPVIHIQHDDGPGSPYDIRDDIGAIVDRVAPRGDEPVVVKNYPNSFVGTDLDERLKAVGAHNLILAGFMTHMCVNSTARGAFNLGYAPTVVAGATATRPLPGPDGAQVPSAAVQAASLAALSDLFAVVVPDTAAIPD